MSNLADCGQATLLKLPKLNRTGQTDNTTLKCFDSFIFNDNFTRNKIVISELQQKYTGNQTSPLRSAVHCEKREHGRRNDYESCSDGTRKHCSDLYRCKKFQLESVRNRDSKYLLEPFSINEVEEPKETLDFSELNELTQMIRKLSRHNLREYLQENKSPKPNSIKLGFINPRERRMTNQQRHKLLRISKLMLLHEFNEQWQMEQDYRRTQHLPKEHAVYQPAKLPSPDKSKPDQLSDMQNQLMSKMDFYVKRTIKSCGEYLIEPTISQLHKNRLAKLVATDEKEKAERPLLVHASKQLDESTNKENNPFQRANEIKKLLHTKDLRNSAQKALFKWVQAGDSFEVNNLLKRDPKLIDCTDSKGNTVLHEAVKLGDAELLALLIEKGGTNLIANRNNIGQLASDISRHFGNDHLLPLLKARQ